jgi:hypothetical protein
VRGCGWAHHAWRTPARSPRPSPRSSASPRAPSRCSAPEEQLYAAGDRGRLLERRDGRWRAIATHSSADLRWFDGRLAAGLGGAVIASRPPRSACATTSVLSSLPRSAATTSVLSDLRAFVTTGAALLDLWPHRTLCSGARASTHARLLTPQSHEISDLARNSLSPESQVIDVTLELAITGHHSCREETAGKFRQAPERTDEQEGLVDGPIRAQADPGFRPPRANLDIDRRHGREIARLAPHRAPPNVARALSSPELHHHAGRLAHYQVRSSASNADR